MSNKITVAKVTLSTGKIVLLREMNISDTEVAAQEVASRSNGDANVLQLLMQKALVRILVVEIDGKKPTATEKEDMNSLFKMGEYNQLLKVVQKMSGAEDGGKEPKIEVVAT